MVYTLDSPTLDSEDSYNYIRRKKPATRTAAQKNVYGKKKNPSIRTLVYDHDSPYKSKPLKSNSRNALQGKSSNESAARAILEGPKMAQAKVEEIETKLADISIQDLSVYDEEEEQRLSSTIEKKATTSTKGTASKTISSAPKSPRQKTPPRLAGRVSTSLNVTRVSTTAPEGEGSSVSGISSCTNSTKRTKAGQRRPATRFSSGCVQNEKVNNYVRSILDEAMSPVSATAVQKFSSWASKADSAFDVIKLAEGSYGEVYKLRIRDDVCQQPISQSKLARLRAYGEGVFKIVPLRAQQGLGSKKFTTVDEITAEVKLLKLMDPIPGFARFREVHVVQGRFPETFQAAWTTYKRTQNDCLNPNPASKRAYPDSQLWAILEMDDAGVELEKFIWSSTFQIYDIFWGIAMALARAEEYALFEHRDLHLGNICLKSNRDNGKMRPPTASDLKSFKSSSGFGLSSLETTIIDYSLSRAEVRTKDDLSEKIEIASCDLDSKQLFDAVGRDEDEILLRNTYRYMRGFVYTGNALDETKPPVIPGIWSEFTPKTNLIWLLFILKCLLKNKQAQPVPIPTITHPPPGITTSPTKRPPLTSCPSKGNIKKGVSTFSKPEMTDSKPKAANTQPKADHKLKKVEVSDEKLEQIFSSLQRDLSGRLNTVLDLLDLEQGREDMCCAADLVAYAIDVGWLDQRDFFQS